MPVPRPSAHPRRHLVAIVGAIAALLAALVVPGSPVEAAEVTANGFTTSTRAWPSQVAHGSTTKLVVTVTAASTRSALVDLEVYDASGRKAFQRYWDAQSFTAGAARTFSATWVIPADQPIGTYRVDVGVFAVGWSSLYHWNSGATTARVVAAPTTTTTVAATTTPPPTTTTTTTTLPPTTTTTTTTTTTLPPTTTTRPPSTTTAPPTGRFVTLPPGSPLPDDATCAARVRPAAENRPANVTPNHVRGHRTSETTAMRERVTGNFVGTTDEIIQWAACKWGIDEDIVRAQTATESWWNQDAKGDLSSNPAVCPPDHGIGVDGFPGQCPESFGVMQLRYQYWGWTFPDGIVSTAFNLDAALSARRSCFEGNDTWLNTVERGRDYAAGDLWGCVGLWFSGRWYTPAANGYIASVQGYLSQRVWEQPGF